MEFIEKLIPSDNPFFSGGLSLGILAVGAGALRSSTGLATSLLRRHFLVTMEVTSKDRSYPWVLQWLAVHGIKRNQHISVETSYKPINRIVDSNSDVAKSLFDFVPAPGQHFIWYSGMFVNVGRHREEGKLDVNTGRPWEKIIFTSIGRNTKLFEKILQESFLFAASKVENKTTVYTNWGSDWRPFGNPRIRRPLDSVILDEGVSENILADVLEWKGSAKWYLDRGIPYRRGYLLHGPPGSGKSSFILALAGHLGYNICVLNLAERGLTDDRLAQALSSVPPESLVLLEDIDAAFPHSRTGPATSGSDVTFSGLLNVLDGVASSEERLLFMTTNHLQRLDNALVRPGRVDLVQLIDDATPHQIRKMFYKFYMRSYSSVDESMEPTATLSFKTLQGSNAESVPLPVDQSQQLSPLLSVLQEQFVESLQSLNRPISMARLQGYLMRHKGSPQDAVNNVDDLLPSHTDSSPPPSHISLIPKPSDSGGKPEFRTRGGRMLSTSEMERLVFNPQPGWDNDIRTIG